MLKKMKENNEMKSAEVDVPHSSKIRYKVLFLMMNKREPSDSDVYLVMGYLVLCNAAVYNTLNPS